MGEANINLLPEDCISTILSITSPTEVCRCSPVSWEMRSISESDFRWKRFLPPNYDKFLSVSSSPVPFPSMKELYFRLCDSILIECSSKFYIGEIKWKEMFHVECKRTVYNMGKYATLLDLETNPSIKVSLFTITLLGEVVVQTYRTDGIPEIFSKAL